MLVQYEFLDYPGTIAFAHQGSGDVVGMRKRNTMEAFQAAYDLGYDYFETDVVAAASGEVMIMHGANGEKQAKKDAEAARAEGFDSGMPARSTLEKMSWDQIQADPADGGIRIAGERIPLLEEVLSTFPDVRVNIDAKTEAAVGGLARVVTRQRAVGRVCIASFGYKRTSAVAEAIHERTGEYVCTSLGPKGFLSVLGLGKGYLEKMQAGCLQLPYRWLDLAPPRNFGMRFIGARELERAHDANMQVHAWTINDQESMESALELKTPGGGQLDGIFTDETRLLKSVMQQRERWVADDHNRS